MSPRAYAGMAAAGVPSYRTATAAAVTGVPVARSPVAASRRSSMAVRKTGQGPTTRATYQTHTAHEAPTLPDVSNEAAAAEDDRYLVVEQDELDDDEESEVPGPWRAPVREDPWAGG